MSSSVMGASSQASRSLASYSHSGFWLLDVVLSLMKLVDAVLN